MHLTRWIHILSSRTYPLQGQYDLHPLEAACHPVAYLSPVRPRLIIKCGWQQLHGHVWDGLFNTQHVSLFCIIMTFFSLLLYVIKFSFALLPILECQNIMEMSDYKSILTGARPIQFRIESSCSAPHLLNEQNVTL